MVRAAVLKAKYYFTYYLAAMTIPERISALRVAMKAHNIDAYLVGSADPHQSEYVAEHWQSRVWLSGFDGSAGTLIVTQKEAKLWTDSRYFIQAETQLNGTGIDLMKLKVPHTPEYIDWLTSALQAGQILGMDGGVASVAQASRLEENMQEIGVDCVLKYDLLAEVWADRPALPSTVPFEHDVAFTETTRRVRLAQLQDFIRAKGLAHYLVIGLDEIAWLLNVRAADVNFNPLCLSYLLVKPDGATWFVGVKRIPAILKARLSQDGITLADYQDVTTELQRIAATTEPVGMDTRLASVAIYRAAGGPQVQREQSPVADWKAIKGPKEIKHYQAAMARDGVALLRLRRWLEQAGVTVQASEVEIAEKLTAFRAEQAHYQGDSFPAIVGYRGNGAIVHYHAHPASCARIDNKGILLVDSGGQYLDGTTDITRTFTLGQPTEEEKLHFTLVLQGMIDLTLAKFPEGTTGVQLDTFARHNLWKHHLNYGHGTGHGVGYFLNVHEGPMSISPNPNAAGPKVPLKPGMILSNEPGYYLPGKHGIRCENLVLVQQEAAGWFGFTTLTLFPFEQQLIQVDLLSTEQKKWLNEYHGMVEQKIGELLTDEEEKKWLRAACAPIF